MLIGKISRRREIRKVGRKQVTSPGSTFSVIIFSIFMFCSPMNLAPYVLLLCMGKCKKLGLTFGQKVEVFFLFLKFLVN